MLDINIYSFINSLIGACLLISLCPLLERLIIRGQISSRIYFLVFLLIFIRLLLPFEIVDRTYLILVEKLLPSIVRFLKTEILSFSFHTYCQNISITILEAIILLLSFISVIKCLKVLNGYYILHIRLKFILPSQDKTIQKILTNIKETYHFKFHVRVIQNKLVDSPFEFGLFKQTICLPDTAYSEEQLYFILSHELCHFGNKSNWLKLFNNLLASVLWWNPLISFYHTSIVSMIEINCDEHIITGSDNHFRAKYLTCLLSELRPPHGKKMDEATHLLSSDEKSLAKRFQFITAKHKKSKAMCCLSVFISISVFIASYFFMILPYIDTLASEIQAPKFTKENAYILKKGDEYIIYYENEPYIYLDTLSDTFSDLIIIEKN